MSAIYAYLRWSSLEQSKGSTLERQQERCSEYAAARGWTITETLIDRGKSAYTGSNIRDGELGRFAGLITSGAIQNPTLIVEELDRLSRQPADVMLTWLSPLVRRGLTIHVQATGQIINEHMLDYDMGGLMMLLITSFGSHKESRKKADRVGAAWQKKRRQAEAGEAVEVNHRHPQWLKVEDGKFVIRDVRAAIVRRMFEMRLNGHGKLSIAQALNTDGVEPWATTARAARSFTPTYVGRVLTNRAVIGEWQPHSHPRGGERKPVGDPIKDYYPAIITPDVFARANDKRAENQRKHIGASRSLSNLLGTRARCRSCGGLMAALGSSRYRENKDGSTSRHYFLYCENAKRARSCDNQRGWTYDRVEGPILDKILTLAMDDQHFSVADAATPIEAECYTIKNEIEALQTRLDRLADMLETDDDPDLRVRWRTRKTELQALRDRLQDAEQRLSEARGATSPAEHLRRVAEVRDLMMADDPEIRFQARSRVKAALGDIIEQITFYPSTGNVGVRLVDGLRRFTISHAGEIVDDLDFATTHPDDVGPGFGVLISRHPDGTVTRSNELDAHQHAASAAYAARHAKAED